MTFFSSLRISFQNSFYIIVVEVICRLLDYSVKYLFITSSKIATKILQKISYCESFSIQMQKFEKEFLKRKILFEK